MKIKWEPLALMALVLALAVWLVAGQGGLRKDPRVSKDAWAVHDIKTGQCLTDLKVRVKSYPVKVEGDAVVVECEEKEP